jgi:hypothetical protein
MKRTLAGLSGHRDVPRTDRRILEGPVVVGVIFRALAAVALAGLHSEYGHNLEPLYLGISS